MYQECFDEKVNSVVCIKRLSDNTFIPKNEANTDYQAYLRWCEEGNTPEPADEPQEE